MSHSPTRDTVPQHSNDAWIVLLIWVGWSLFKVTAYLLWLAILFPALSVPAFLSLAVMLRYGIGAGMLTAMGLGAGYGLWAALDSQSFESWIAQPTRQRFQSWWRYTRTWETVCALNGLTAQHQDRILTPLVRSIWIGKHTDVIDLRVVTGQSVNDWQKRIRELAAAWRADRLTIRATAPGDVRITITRFDFLVDLCPCHARHRAPLSTCQPCRSGSPTPTNGGAFRCSVIICSSPAPPGQEKDPCCGR